MINIPENNLFVLLLNKNNYNQYKDLIDLKYIKENYRELSYLYGVLLELREVNPDKDISLDEVRTFFHVKYPDVQQGIYDTLFKTLQELRLDPGVGEGILAAFKTPVLPNTVAPVYVFDPTNTNVI